MIIANTNKETKAITIPEVKLFNLTGLNSPINMKGMTLKPTEWNRRKALRLITVMIAIAADVPSDLDTFSSVDSNTVAFALRRRNKSLV